MKSPKFLMVSFSVILSLFLLSCAPVGEDDLPPEPKAPGADGGLVGQAYTAGLAAAGYADPTGYFSINPGSVNPDMLNIWTPESTTLLSSRVENDQLIYRYGYYTDASGRWVQFEFAGTRVGTSNWLRAPATKELTLGLTAAAGVNQVARGENFIAAYACSKVGRTWNCHNGKWMAHSYTLQLTPCYADSDCAGAGADYFCDGGAGMTAGTCALLPEGPEGPSELELCYGYQYDGPYPPGVGRMNICQGPRAGYASAVCMMTAGSDGRGTVGPDCSSIEKIGVNDEGISTISSACVGGVVVNKSRTTVGERDVRLDCATKPLSLTDDYGNNNAEGPATCVSLVNRERDLTKDTGEFLDTLHPFAGCGTCGKKICQEISGRTYVANNIDNTCYAGDTETGIVNGPGCELTFTCTDGDGGKDYTRKTSVTVTLSDGRSATYEDECIGDYGHISEKYCTADGFAKSTFGKSCPSGTTCSDGACH